MTTQPSLEWSAVNQARSAITARLREYAVPLCHLSCHYVGLLDTPLKPGLLLWQVLNRIDRDYPDGLEHPENCLCPTCAEFDAEVRDLDIEECDIRERQAQAWLKYLGMTEYGRNRATVLREMNTLDVCRATRFNLVTYRRREGIEHVWEDRTV
jgi:hypothetical protein